MWTDLVVIDHPPMRCLAHVLKACEEVLVQDLLAEGAVETFGEGMLVGLDRLDVSERHADEFGPLGECLARVENSPSNWLHDSSQVMGRSFECLGSRNPLRRSLT